MPALVPLSAGADLLQRGLGLSLDGVAQINVPAIAVPSADFVGEGAPIPVVTAPTTPGAQLLPHKLAVITSLTRELMESSNAEAMVRQVLIEATGPAIDQVLFTANPSGADRPAGLLNGIAALTPAGAAGGKGENLVDDVQQLATAVSHVAGNGGMVLVAAPAQAAALAMRVPAVVWPVLTTAFLASGTVIAVATNALVAAVQSVPEITASREAEVVMNTTPTDVVDGGTPGQPIMSMYQVDAVSLRLKWPISWARRDVRGVAWLSGVNW